MVLETGPATLADWRAKLDGDRSCLAGALQNFLMAYKVEEKSPATIDRLRRTVGDFIRFAKEQGFPQEATKIHPNHIRLYLVHLQERGLQPVTRNWHYRCLHMFFEWLRREGTTDKSPLDPIKPPRVPRKVVQTCTRDHIEKLLSLCPSTTFLGARDHAILLMFLGTGLRRHELASLRLQDVDLNQECVKVMGKGAKERRVYLCKPIVKALLSYMAFRKDHLDFLWVSEEGRPLESNGIRLAVYRLQKRAGIQGVRISSHTFRHTFAVNALRAGISLRHLQAIGGWANMRPLEIYLATIDAEDGMEVHRKADPLGKMGVKG